MNTCLPYAIRKNQTSFFPFNNCSFNITCGKCRTSFIEKVPIIDEPGICCPTCKFINILPLEPARNGEFINDTKYINHSIMNITRDSKELHRPCQSHIIYKISEKLDDGVWTFHIGCRECNQTMFFCSMFDWDSTLVNMYPDDWEKFNRAEEWK